jgi:hypothetical protein
MFNKKEIDLFILREAFNFLKDDVSQELKDIEDRYSEKENKYKEEIDDLNTKISISKTQKDASNKSANAPKITSSQKQYYTTNASQHDKNVKSYNEMKKELEQKIIDMKNEKAEDIRKANEKESQQKSEVNISINENVNAPNQSPVQPKLQHPKTQQQAQSKIQQQTKVNIQPEKSKDLIVRFDTNTSTPFTVKFTKRGFVVGGTRMSFDLIEQAINKRFSITLKSGLILTPVKMQKILKYKERI